MSTGERRGGGVSGGVPGFNPQEYTNTGDVRTGQGLHSLASSWATASSARKNFQMLVSPVTPGQALNVTSESPNPMVQDFGKASRMAGG